MERGDEHRDAGDVVHLQSARTVRVRLLLYASRRRDFPMVHSVRLLVKTLCKLSCERGL